LLEARTIDIPAFHHGSNVPTHAYRSHSDCRRRRDNIPALWPCPAQGGAARPKTFYRNGCNDGGEPRSGRECLRCLTSSGFFQLPHSGELYRDLAGVGTIRGRDHLQLGEWKTEPKVILMKNPDITQNPRIGNLDTDAEKRQNS
jgi:hypothetical protein